MKAQLRQSNLNAIESTTCVVQVAMVRAPEPGLARDKTREL